ncbi:hypothetical protein [Alkalicoccobacillus murimartini]|uniref:Uncharacterized protein n=1 Tax=Alkalicoccobacillus murimartini TaxID=171685 RepID=A0ABT9YDV5_9BACI|nr:hypothetical protein [Alkalicoccobacillus murimartini]MDQ0205813.1 hypothetical protein [Alkalicoccobacillus murimartini]
MTEEMAKEILVQLKCGETSECRVAIAEFLTFQPVLFKHEEFKNFRGVANHGGAIV